MCLQHTPYVETPSCQISDIQVPFMSLSTNLESIQQPFCPGLTETFPHSIEPVHLFFFFFLSDGAICFIV